MWPERVLRAKTGKQATTPLPPSLGPHSRPCPVCRSRDRDYDDIDGADPFNPQARRIATHNPPRGQLRSFCSYSSGLGSQTSLQPPAQTISNAPVSEYMYGSGSPGLPLHMSPHIAAGAAPAHPALGELDLGRIWVQRTGLGGRHQKPAMVPSPPHPAAATRCLVGSPPGGISHPSTCAPRRCQALPSGQIAGPRSCLSPSHAAPGPWCPIRCFSPGPLLFQPTVPPRSVSLPHLHMHTHGALLEKSEHPHPSASPS